jgi:hypothetical protein
MNKAITLALAATLLAAGGTAVAQSPSSTTTTTTTTTTDTNSKPQVVEKDAKGHPTKISINGQVYPVCTATVTDGCVNPRQAGLKTGNAPMNNWPGHPASEKPGQ